MEKTLTIVTNGKGGVGKSMITRTIIDYMVANDCKPVVVDADTTNTDVFKVYKDSLKCVCANMDDTNGFIEFAKLLEKSEDSIVVNTPARLTDMLIDMGENLCAVAKECGYKINLFWPVDRQRDSVELLTKLLKSGTWELDDITVIRNNYYGSADKFTILDKFIEAGKYKVKIADFPELNDTIADHLSNKRLSFDKTEGLSMFEKGILSAFRRNAHKVIADFYQ